MAVDIVVGSSIPDSDRILVRLDETTGGRPGVHIR